MEGALFMFNAFNRTFKGAVLHMGIVDIEKDTELNMFLVWNNGGYNTIAGAIKCSGVYGTR
jgi:hypothetical protein